MDLCRWSHQLGPQTPFSPDRKWVAFDATFHCKIRHQVALWRFTFNKSELDLKSAELNDWKLSAAVYLSHFHRRKSTEVGGGAKIDESRRAGQAETAPAASFACSLIERANKQHASLVAEWNLWIFFSIESADRFISRSILLANKIPPSDGVECVFHFLWKLPKEWTRSVVNFLLPSWQERGPQPICHQFSPWEPLWNNCPTIDRAQLSAFAATLKYFQLSPNEWKWPTVVPGFRCQRPAAQRHWRLKVK